jgi:hypothetical protein
MLDHLYLFFILQWLETLALPLLDCISTIKIVQVMLKIHSYAWNPLLLRLPVLSIWDRWVDGILQLFL